MSDTQTASNPKESAAASEDRQAYRVLARKYRPQVFSDLIGQNAMVRTLANAFSTGRIAQAYMLTGVRGVGKTTTARLIARALNYEPMEGEGGPTTDLSELGRHCKAIMESRHVDVVEMDAASHTGIDDIREIIEAVRYRPASARYKVYIIDEVHMLSKAAFNGLLKTLEEPPPHVKFVFATTEIRKVPVTVLSRCQRFDLRRIDTEQLIFHLSKIAGLEQVSAEDQALSLIARAAEGSVRDALSLLDQAIALCGAEIKAEDVHQMLGLADRARTIDLLDKVLGGDIGTALVDLKAQYDAGADPLVVITDMASLVHWITRLKLVPDVRDDQTVAEEERRRGAEMADKLAMRDLTRAWQLLLKGIAEVQTAANPLAAADMLLVRLAYASSQPAPDELVRQLTRTADGERAQPQSGSAPASSPAPARAGREGGAMAQVSAAPDPAPEEAPRMQTDEPDPAPALPQPGSFEEVVALAGAKRDIKLKSMLERNVRLVSFRIGHIDVALVEGANAGLTGDLARKLTEWTGTRWMVSVSQADGQKTLHEQERERHDEALAQALRNPVVSAALDLFPGAEVLSVRDAFEVTDTDGPLDGIIDEDGIDEDGE